MASNDAALEQDAVSGAVVHSFRLAPTTLWAFRFIIVAGTAGMLGFAAFCLYLYLVDDQSFHSTFDRNVVVGVFGGGTLAVAACLARQWGRVNRATIHTNDEGIWQDGREDELIRWEQVSHARERPVQQCMELLDDNHNRLIRIENQIEDYAVLQSLILAKAHVMSNREAGPYSIEGPRTHTLSVLVPVGYGILLLLAVYMFSESIREGGLMWPLLYGLGALLFGGLVATAPLRLTLLPDRLEIRHLIHTKRIPREKVVEIRIDSEMENFQRYPSVAIVMEGESDPIQLGRGDTGAINLYAVLLDWREMPKSASSTSPR